MPTVVYLRVAHFEFVKWDDDRMIYENPHVESLSWENLHWMLTDRAYNHVYMPPGWLSYALSVAVVGLNAGQQHWINLAMHLANTVLVFFILRELLRAYLLRRKRSVGDEKALVLAAFGGSLLWSLHPLRTEVVAWVGARVHSNATLFLLTSFLLYLIASRPGGIFYKKAALWFSVLFYLVSILSFPTGIAVPLLLPILDVYVLDRPPQRTVFRGLIHYALEKLPFYLLLVIPAAVVFAQRSHAALLSATTRPHNFGLMLWGHKLHIAGLITPGQHLLLWIRRLRHRCWCNLVR